MENREKINKQSNYYAFFMKMLKQKVNSFFLQWDLFFGAEEVVNGFIHIMPVQSSIV